jgi:hypothetical protein
VFEVYLGSLDYFLKSMGRTDAGRPRRDVIPRAHLRIDLVDGLLGNFPRPLIPVIQNLLDITGRFLELAPPFQQGFETKIDAGDQVALAVKTARPGRGTFEFSSLYRNEIEEYAPVAAIPGHDPQRAV